MSATALNLLILGDGKPGHQNQSLGLADAIGRLTPVQTSVVTLKGGFSERLRMALTGTSELPRPDLVLGAGHAVHLALLAVARRYDCSSVVLMKPSLPRFLFDLCLVPLHDLKRADVALANVVPTFGALNRVPPLTDGAKSGRMLLIGGPSAAHGWDQKTLLEQVRAIASSGGWEVTDSRRTPAGVLEELAAACPGLTIHPHAGTGPDWLPAKLAGAKEAWVTEDSVSMIYEALSSGAHVGLLPIPVTKPGGRVLRGIARLAEEGYVTPFPAWKPGGPLPAPPRILREADRCARLLLERFFPRLLPS